MASNGNPASGFNQLQKIVNFAIEKEQESADFYTNLAGKVKTRSIAEELKKLADMEIQHRERLRKMDPAAASSAPARSVADLKIADYVVRAEPTPEMSWQEILTIAMHREMATMKLYQDLAALVPEGPTRQMFTHLAAEESGHKLYFERIWDDEILIEN